VEAEVTSGLEHAGIVPVYGLGSYADGRPLYAMRFIKGDNLEQAIERFHGRASGSSHAPGDSSNRGVLLRLPHQLSVKFVPRGPEDLGHRLVDDVADALWAVHAASVGASIPRPYLGMSKCRCVG